MIPATKMTETRTFFEYLEDWFYRELSQESHLSFPGLATRAGLLEAAEKNMTDSDVHLHQYKSVQATITFIIMLAICSEIELYFNFGLKERILVMWKMSEALPIPKEIWERRYQGLFSKS
jgi:hypothetical protein